MSFFLIGFYLIHLLDNFLYSIAMSKCYVIHVIQRIIYKCRRRRKRLEEQKKNQTHFFVT